MSVKDAVYEALKAPMIHARAQLYSKAPEIIFAWAVYGLTVWNEQVNALSPPARVEEAERLLLRMIHQDS